MKFVIVKGRKKGSVEGKVLGSAAIIQHVVQKKRKTDGEEPTEGAAAAERGGGTA